MLCFRINTANRPSVNNTDSWEMTEGGRIQLRKREGERERGEEGEREKERGKEREGEKERVSGLRVLTAGFSGICVF